MNNNWHKKEKPLIGLTGLGGGVDGLSVVGAGALPPKYVDEVFNSYVWDGVSDAAQNIASGIDMTKGGMVWNKRRDASGNHVLMDSERGADYALFSNLTLENQYITSGSAFTDTGFTWASENNYHPSGSNLCSWTFRKREKFFDMVAYTGNNSGQTSQRDINHNLGITPGMFMIKNISDGSSDWKVYHRGMGSAFMNALTLNDSAAMTSAEGWWHYTAPNDVRFTIGNADEVNKEGDSFICYLFAHHDSTGVFGPDENKDIIHCDYYTGNGSSTGPEVNLGWEPQWVLIKDSQSVGNWRLYDSKRGISTGLDDQMLRPDNNQAEATSDRIDLTSTGFKLTNSDTDLNANGKRYVYTAIRRPDGYVGKPPSAGTDVFAMDTGAGSSTIPNFDSTFPVDFGLVKLLEPWNATEDWYACNRLITKSFVQPSNQGAQGGAASMNFDSNLGWSSESSWSNYHQSWMWKRGQGMDVVAYSGNGVDGRNLNHSLNQAPQMIWIKNRTDSGNTGDWMVGHKDLNGGSSPWNYYLVLNKTQGEYSDSNPFNNSAPTSTTFELDSWDRVNASGSDYVAFLFASANDADGNPISKVGSYTGDGTSDHEITTGFQPRFVLLKRASGTANWYLMDTLRGMGNTSTHRLKLNTDAAQDEPAGGPYVVPVSTGFDVRKETSEWNNNGDTYIYYAHA